MLICIHMISWLLSSKSSTICLLYFRSLRTVIATPPPLRSGLGLWYHGAYPSSAGGFPFVSAIATMWLFWLSAAACRLVILPLVPFTLAYSILIWLWFSVSFFPGSFLLFVIGGFGLLLLLVLVPYGTVHGCWVVNYRGLLLGYINLGSAIPRHKPLKHIVAWQLVNQCRDDLQTSSLWYQLMSHYTDNSCANFEEAPGRAHKRIRYVCLTMSLHGFRLWLGAAYTTHYYLNKWWHKPTMYDASLGLRMLTHGGQDKMAAIFLTTQIVKFMAPTWGPSGSCRPQMGPMLDPWTLLSGDIFKEIFLIENVWFFNKISLKSVSEGPINNIPASVQIMAGRRPGDEQVSEPMMVRLPSLSLSHFM